MIDSHGRNIEYLRLSLTERCNLNCIYCREAGHGNEQQMPTQEITAQEIVQIMQVMGRLGIRKVRLTGGEPLLRPDLEEIVQAVRDAAPMQDISVTTNAQGLSRRAASLKRSGVMRLNISLDSLNEEKYRRMTRGGSLQQVLDGIRAAVENELLPLKINVVVVRGWNDDEVDDFIRFAKENPVDVRFIELMPIGKLGREESNRIANADLIAARPYLVPIEPRYQGQPSQDFTGPDFLGRVGFISPLSKRFCNLCNRIRVTSDAKLKPCLGSNVEASLRDAIAAGTLEETIWQTIYDKPEGHHFEKDFDSLRNMSRIGG